MSAIDDDPRPIPPFKMDIPTFVRVCFWISGALTIVVGLVFIGTEFALQAPCSGNQGCIGPSLRWGPEPFTVERDLNANWRFVFSLQPSQLVEKWTPVFFGIISITAHFPGFQYAWLTKNWFHMACWNIFLALFGHLGYGGNLGVMFGVFAIIVAFMCLFMQFTKWRNERPMLHMGLGGILDRWGFMADNEVMHNIARGLGLAVGLLTIVVGFVEIFTYNFQWCPQTVGGTTYDQCLGPSLRWNNGGPNQDFVADANKASGFENGWRSIFTFNPEFFFPIWGPVILGYITVIQHLKGREWSIYRTWPRVFLFFLFVGLFGNMGYLGVLVGFLAILESFLAVLISVAGGANTRTHFEIRIAFLEKDGE